MAAIVITYDDFGSPTDITADVVFESANFEQSMNGVPGTFTITVRDPNQTHSFATGRAILLTVDAVPMFGGFVTQVSMGSLAPAADTSDLGTYDLRTWTLRGVDNNILFDRRFLRDASNPPNSYLTQIAIPVTTDGAELIAIVDNYIDADGLSSAGINSSAPMPVPSGGDDLLQQGIPLRQIFQQDSFFGGTVWYIDPNLVVVYVPFESVEKRWGFSDQPNHNAITVSPASYQGATTGFREVEATEDGSYIVNDALVWGGSQIAGASGGLVFARVEDATSQSTYNRWQTAELHAGEQYYETQDGVDKRANSIVFGPPGTDAYGLQKGLRYAQWEFRFTWFSVDVPLLDGSPDHLRPGDIVTIVLAAFGVTQLLPLRSLRTSFPDALEDDGSHIVKFEGTFGLQLSDPFTLWRYLLTNVGRVTTQTISTAGNTTSATTYGSYYQGIPSPLPDDTTTLFTIPFPYIGGTLQVYQDTGSGLALLRNGVDFTETDPAAGSFTMTTAPAATDNLYVVALTLSATTTPPGGYTFFDDFNTLDSAVWARNGYTITDATETHSYAGGNAFASGSILTLRASRFAANSWDVALINTFGTFSQLYGLFEARIKIPKGRGLWPAFWAYPGSTSQELDIMEIGANPIGDSNGGSWGDASDLHTTIHFGGGGSAARTPPYSGIGDLSLAYHVYAMDWRAGYVAFLLDGVEVWRYTGGSIPNTAMCLFLDNVVGASFIGPSDGSTPSPSDMLVDWVRVSA